MYDWWLIRHANGLALLTPEERAVLLQRGRRKTVPEGGHVVWGPEPGVLVVVDGALQLSSCGPWGDEKLLLTSGDMAGTLLSYPCHLVADAPTTLVTFSHQAWLDLLAADARVATALLRRMGECLARHDECSQPSQVTRAAPRGGGS